MRKPPGVPQVKSRKQERACPHLGNLPSQPQWPVLWPQSYSDVSVRTVLRGSQPGQLESGPPKLSPGWSQMPLASVWPLWLTAPVWGSRPHPPPHPRPQAPAGKIPLPGWASAPGIGQTQVLARETRASGWGPQALMSSPRGQLCLPDAPLAKASGP